MKKRTQFLCWGGCALLPVSLALILLAKGNPAATEAWYSLGFYRVWAGLLVKITSRLPFSLAELLVIAAGGGTVLFLGCFLRGLAKGKGKRRKVAKSYLLPMAAVSSAVLFLFVLGGGLNYYRYSFTHYSGLEPKASETALLADLCRELAGEANQERQGLPQDEDGEFLLKERPQEWAATAAQNYQRLMEKNPSWEGLFELSAATRVKPVFFSKAMSYMQIVGVFCPFTMEANVNVDTTDFDIPAAACHELAHISGFMREDEANFLAYAACRVSASQAFRYSGTMLAFIHATNALYARDPQEYERILSGLSPEVRRDLAASAAYYQAHQSRFGDFSTQVNNAYLKVNSQQDGVASYGRMVDLLLADYQKRNA